MTVAVVALAIALAAALPLIAWLAYRIVTGPALLADERIAHNATQTKLERVTWESEQKDKALDAAAKTIDALIKERSHAKPNADLPAGDVDSRLLRGAEEARADRDDPVPTGAVEPVHSRGTTEAAEATEVLPAGPLDPNESLL